MIGLIPRTCEYIEKCAESVLSEIGRDILYKPQALPVQRVITYLIEKHNIPVEYSDTLESPGRYDIASKTILISSAIFYTSRLRFVLAHEMGHALLHGDVKFEDNEYYEQASERKEYDIFTGKRKLKTERDILEWQASRFASAITIPRLRFKSKLIEIQNRLGIPKRGKVYQDGQRCNILDYRKTYILAGIISRVF